jgi:hypothetical protein
MDRVELSTRRHERPKRTEIELLTVRPVQIDVNEYPVQLCFELVTYMAVIASSFDMPQR